MWSKFLRLQWFCLFALFFFVVGCSLSLGSKKPEGEREFAQEISRLEKLARGDPEASVRAKSHLKLVFLHVNSRNPQLNYSRALQEMESYLSMAPEKMQEEDIKNWLAALREISKLQASLKKVQGANIHLREEVTSLKETNNRMARTIEKLKTVDLQMEEKRSLIK